jgi:hypothetical protein
LDWDERYEEEQATHISKKDEQEEALHLCNNSEALKRQHYHPP